MAKSRSTKKSQKQSPPATTYPAAPHLIGLDWLELPVRRPARSAVLYRALGFTTRGTVGPHPLLSAGGTTLLLRACRLPHAGILLQLAVDNADLKHTQMLELGLNPTPIRRLKRGDLAFEWRDPDGHVIRFVGPVRQSDDPRLD